MVKTKAPISPCPAPEDTRPPAKCGEGGSMEMRCPAHGVKRRQTAQESGDYLSFKLPYRLNQLGTCNPVHRPRDQARTQNTDTHINTHTNPHTQW